MFFRSLLMLLCVLGTASDAGENGATPVTSINAAAHVGVPATQALPSASGVLPGAQVLFDTIGIRVAGGEQAQFIVGDNIAGYYEGYSHAFRKGDGYRMKAVTLFQGHAAFVNGGLLDRRRVARSDTIQPYGHRADYGYTSESLLMHSGQYALSLRIDSEQAAELASLPLWSFDSSEYRTEMVGSVLLLVPYQPITDDVPRIIALTSPQAFRVDVGFRPSAGAAADLVIGSNTLTPLLVSAMPTKRFTVHIAFGFSRQQALAKARALATTDSWNAELAAVYRRLTRSHLWTSDADYNRALVWAKASASSFVVEEFGKGIWAGLPWFRDNWGRDTFIALPGTLLVAGRFAEAKAVLDNFARLQQRDDLNDGHYGRIPNRVSAAAPIIYNTVDGTPWMIREVLEYLRYSGDFAYGNTMLPLIRDYVKGVRTHWLDADGLLKHDDADTWMDARIANKEAWSPRGDRAVEIQALWFTALEVGATLAKRAGLDAKAAEYADLAATVRKNFPTRFWDGQVMADRLRPDGSRDTTLRPNQLMLVSIPDSPFVPDPVQARVVRNAVSGLLFPYGIASLDPHHPNFHPRYENPAFHHKDAAYHNGTIWGWNAGFTVTALNKFGYQDLSWQLSRNLATQILQTGTRGSMSELLDALPDTQGNVHPSGTYAQAWSVAEFARNAYQDYLGFRPDLLNDVLTFVPALPAAWTELQAHLPYGQNEALALRLNRVGDSWQWRFLPGVSVARTVRLDLLATDHSRRRLQFRLSGKPQIISWDGRHALLDGKVIMTTMVMASQSVVIGELKMAVPRRYLPEQFPVLRSKDVLQTRILEGKQQ